MANITGSRAFERFTGPQIKHHYKHQPLVYNTTERISLISSFISTLLIGEYAPIDLSDSSGMNLLDIRTRDWNQTLLDAAAPNLRERLGKPVASDTRVGLISAYWCRKYGFSPKCEIYAFSGDNPCSLIGLGLNKPGDVGLSLGTSDVLFAVTNEPKPNSDEGSILIHPQNVENYMMMLVYKNGATARQFVRDSCAKNDNDWSSFNKCILNSPPGCENCISFYFIETEITPNALNPGIVKFNADNESVNSALDDRDCRGIIEAQVLSYKHHAELLGLNKISSIVVTGGGSVNKEILQIVADIFEMEVSSSSVANTAASGAAIRALNAYEKLHGSILSCENIEEKNSQIIVKPNSDNFAIYRKLYERFGKLEGSGVEILNRNS